SEIETLQAGEDRSGALRNLLRVGRDEHEYDSWGRLLEDLEERIPRLARQHVCLVHDVDLVTALARGGVHGALTQVAGVVHAPVRGGIELDDVEVRRASPDARAGIALPARLTRRPRTASLAIERHREDTRRRGLANATRTREQVSVRHPGPRHGPTQRGRHVILHEEVGKALGTVFSGESDHLLKSNG